MEAPHPTGILTLVFTDIEGSSDLWQQYGSAFQPVLERHNALMRSAAAARGGFEVKTVGDSFFLVFSSAGQAVRFAAEAQLAFARCDWSTVAPMAPAVRVRMGLHTGEPLVVSEPGQAVDYFGPAVNRAARVGSAGHGGQVVLSGITRELAEQELSRSGEELDALLAFEDRGRHRLKGVGEEQLYQLLHPDLARDFPPLSTLDPQRHNLPVPPTPFIGREEDVEGWLASLRDPNVRLLTLLGFGGMGKTRAALHLAELCTDHFAHGVWWVPLEETRDADGMRQEIAAQLKLAVQPQPSVEHQLHAYLKERELLLVLDNAEQLGPDAARIASSLLAAAPKVKLLVTSRRALDIRAERRAEVRPLTPEDAVTLFEAAARGRRAEFEVTDENREDVTELCERLERVPLAIELAASRIEGMSPRGMLERLSSRFQLLQTRSPDLPARQRALRGAIDWSYDLLESEEQALLAQLAVFHGGFTLEAAEAICRAFDVFESVMELQRHSFLRSETDAGTQGTRFTMLESVRSYAADRLSGTEFSPDGLAQAHAEHYASWGESLRRGLRTRAEMPTLRRLNADVSNLRAAFGWSCRNERPELCARLGLVLYEVLYRGGSWAEARDDLLQAASSAAAVPDAQALQASVARSRAGLAIDMGDLEAARAAAQEALDLGRAAGDPQGELHAMNLFGLIARADGDLETARKVLDEILPRLEPGDDHLKGIVIHNLALVALQRGETARAGELLRTALTHRRAAGDARGEAETLSNLGVVAFLSGEKEVARDTYHANLDLWRTLEDRHHIAVALANLGELEEEEGDLAVAVAFYTHAERLFEEVGSVYLEEVQSYTARVRQRMDPSTYEKLRAQASVRSWEEIVFEEKQKASGRTNPCR